jgi:hypothetical protein
MYRLVSISEWRLNMKTMRFAAIAVVATLTVSVAPASAASIPSSVSDVAGASPAVATAVAIKEGAYLRSADGRRIGTIDAVDTAGNGVATGAQVIIDGRIVHIPSSTISATDRNHFTTSLSAKDVAAL